MNKKIAFTAAVKLFRNMGFKTVSRSINVPPAAKFSREVND